MRSVARRPATIDAYLSRVKGQRGVTLGALRRTIRSIVPGVEECISYGMPAFRLDGRVIAGFAATARGCSYYPFSGATLATLAEELTGYEGTRSAVHFEPDRPLPVALVRKLLRARVTELTASGRGSSGARPRPARPRRGR
jgi:uncharacterized protein YdhG (YjbR/CyaY superfamily)